MTDNYNDIFYEYPRVRPSHDILYEGPCVGDIVQLIDSPSRKFSDKEHNQEWLVTNVTENSKGDKLTLTSLTSLPQFLCVDYDCVVTVEDVREDLSAVLNEKGTNCFIPITFTESLDDFIQKGDQGWIWQDPDFVDRDSLYELVVVKNSGDVSTAKHISLSLSQVNNLKELKIQKGKSIAFQDKYRQFVIPVLYLLGVCVGTTIKFLNKTDDGIDTCYYMFSNRDESVCVYDKNSDQEIYTNNFSKDFIIQYKKPPREMSYNDVRFFAHNILYNSTFIRLKQDIRTSEITIPKGSELAILNLHSDGNIKAWVSNPDKNQMFKRTFKFPINTESEEISITNQDKFRRDFRNDFLKWMDSNGFGLGTMFVLKKDSGLYQAHKAVYGKYAEYGYIVGTNLCYNNEVLLHVMFENDDGSSNQEMNFKFDDCAPAMISIKRTDVKSIDVFARTVNIGDDAEKFFKHQYPYKDVCFKHVPYSDIFSISKKCGKIYGERLLEKYPEGVKSIEYIPEESLIVNDILDAIIVEFKKLNEISKNLPPEEMEGINKFKSVYMNYVCDPKTKIISSYVQYLYDALNSNVSSDHKVIIVATQSTQDGIDVGKEYTVSKVRKSQQYTEFIFSNGCTVTPAHDKTLLFLVDVSKDKQYNKGIADMSLSLSVAQENWFQDMNNFEEKEPHVYDYTDCFQELSVEDLISFAADRLGTSEESVDFNDMKSAYQDYFYEKFCKNNSIDPFTDPWHNRPTKTLLDAAWEFAYECDLVPSEVDVEEYLEERERERSYSDDDY